MQLEGLQAQIPSLFFGPAETHTSPIANHFPVFLAQLEAAHSNSEFLAMLETKPK